MRIKIEKYNGKVTYGRQKLFNALADLEDDTPYQVVIKEWKDERSINQNNLMWEWLDIMAEEFGYRDSEELYDVMIDMYAPIYTVEDLEGNPKQKKLTTSRMDTKQMSDFMRNIDQLAAEHNIQLPKPEEELI